MSMNVVTEVQLFVHSGVKQHAINATVRAVLQGQIPQVGKQLIDVTRTNPTIVSVLG